MISQHKEKRVQAAFDKWMRLAHSGTASRKAILRAMNKFATEAAAATGAAVVASMLCWLIGICIVQPMYAEQPAAVTVEASREVNAAIAPSKKRPVIIAEFDQSVTVTFSECRENEKEHVSCKMEDSEGNEHWVYIPGLKLKAAKK